VPGAYPVNIGAYNYDGIAFEMRSYLYVICGAQVYTPNKAKHEIHVTYREAATTTINFGDI
jgi:hypothetical protein